MLLLIWMHFIADFLAQNDAMATRKSSSNLWLGAHALTYTAFMLIFGVRFALINGLLHFTVDWITSRGTTYLFKRGERHWFFSLIGLDQAIHMTILYYTYPGSLS